MKLSLNQLRVDSYTVQVSETELTEVKGGTTIPCIMEILLPSDPIGGPPTTLPTFPVPPGSPGPPTSPYPNPKGPGKENPL